MAIGASSTMCGSQDRMEMQRPLSKLYALPGGKSRTLNQALGPAGLQRLLPTKPALVVSPETSRPGLNPNLQQGLPESKDSFRKKGGERSAELCPEGGSPRTTANCWDARRPHNVFTVDPDVPRTVPRTQN